MTSELSKLLLEAVSTECTAFEAVIDHVMPSESKDSADCNFDSVEGRLLTLIGEGFVEAFLLHAEPPYLTPVVPSLRTLPGFWFHITAKGEQHLGGLLNTAPSAEIPESTPFYC